MSTIHNQNDGIILEHNIKFTSEGLCATKFGKISRNSLNSGILCISNAEWFAEDQNVSLFFIQTIDLYYILDVQFISERKEILHSLSWMLRDVKPLQNVLEFGPIPRSDWFLSQSYMTDHWKHLHYKFKCRIPIPTRVNTCCLIVL